MDCKKISFPIPFYTQKNNPSTYTEDGFLSPEESTSWDIRGCGIASFRMVLDGFLQRDGKPLCLPQGSMIHKGLEKNAYLSGVGWIHKGLADLAADYGYTATAFRGKTIEDLQQEILHGNPCIVSVTPRLAPERYDTDRKPLPAGGHLIVVFGTIWKGDICTNMIIHHPSCFPEYNWQEKIVPMSIFLPAFSGNYIVFYDKKP